MTRQRLGRGRAWVLWSALGVLAGSAQMSGCADSAPPDAPQTFGFQIALERIEAPIIVPGSRLRVVGAGYLEGGAWAGRVVGTLGGVTVDRIIAVERRADDLLDLLWSAEAFGDLPEGTFVGRIDLAARYGDRISLIADGRIVESGASTEVLTTETIAEHFGAQLHATNHPHGGAMFELRMQSADSLSKKAETPSNPNKP